jgi:ABC-type antimicrobial peptide transport system permease subunit
VVLIGVSVGIAASLAGARVIVALLYGVSANDPAMVVFAGVVLGSVAIAAGYIPARRASRIDPMAALREE